MIWRGPGLGSRAAIAASVALLVAGLAAVPMSVSSAGSAALKIQLDQECGSDLGLILPADDDETLERLAARAGSIDHLLPAEVSRFMFATYRTGISDDGLTREAMILSRPDQLDHVESTAGSVGPDEVVVPEWITSNGLYLPGTTIELTQSHGSQVVVLDIVGTYSDIPSRPEPEYWCSYRKFIRLGVFGDRPPPLLLVDDATFDSFDPHESGREWTLSPDPAGLRRDQGNDLLEELQALLDDEWGLGGFTARNKPPVRLETSLRRSGQVADFVALTTAPLRYAAAAAALVLLVAAGVLAARSQRRELRLRTMRGVSMTRLAIAQLRWLVPTVLAGAGIGWLAAWIVVRTLGPSPDVEPAAIVSGTVAGAIGCVVATVTVAAAIALVGNATVDAPSRRRIRPGLIPLVLFGPLAVWSFRRLDRFGGVRQIGVELRGGDLLAQAFPLLGAIAIIAVLAPVAPRVIRQMRRRGRGLRPALLIGIRRVGFEPVMTTTVLLATALSVAVAFQASLLTASVDRLLADKATMFVGADLSIHVLESPTGIDGLGGASTEVVRARSDDLAVLGVDPATFAAAAYWRDDGLPIPLASAIGAIAAAPGTAAILVDPDAPSGAGPGDGVTISIDGEPREMELVAVASFFPGYKNGQAMLVVDRSVVDGERADLSIWIRDPVPDAVERVEARGARVAGSIAPSEVFDATNFLSAKWAYDMLTVFAVALAIVTLIGQLLVVESRQRLRRSARVLTRPMGVGLRDEFVATSIEVGAPLVTGGAIGAGIGWVTAWVAIGRLDSLRNLEPPADLVTPLGTLAVTVGAVAVATIVLAAIATSRSGGGQPSEVIRVAEQ